MEWRGLLQWPLRDGLDLETASGSGSLVPSLECSLCFFAYDIIRSTYMNVCRACGACNESDAKYSIQGGLRHHNVVPGRYTAVYQAVQVVERFKSQGRLVGFGFWNISENSQSERWLYDEREIRRGPDEGGKKVV